MNDFPISIFRLERVEKYIYNYVVLSDTQFFSVLS